jgi:ribonuclease HII
MKNKFASFTTEQRYWDQNMRYICGIDEVGRGAWAGPVVAAAVIFPPQVNFSEGLADSKQLTATQREILAEQIKATALSWAIGESPSTYVDRRGIVAATQYAMRQALRQLTVQPDFHLIDAFYIRYIPRRLQLPIIKGDATCASIAAASIVAKVYRDQLMCQYGEQTEFIHYSFATHKGYGTKKHQEAISTHGLCELHRKTFVRKLLVK